MLTLALESSTDVGSVALGAEGELLAEGVLAVRGERSENLLPEVRRTLERCGRSVGGLERMVVGAGPGSFTGVRIAASLGKGLVAALGCELLAYTGLEALAEASGVPGPVCALLPARQELVYAAAWTRRSPPETRLEPTVLGLGVLMERLGEPERWTFAGPGARRHEERIREAGGRVPASVADAPRASALLRLAEERPEAGRIEDPRSWEPSYLRAPGAERRV